MINHSNKILPNIRVKKKQQGAALMTVLVFLLVMTVVAVSGSKIAILDALVAGNDQQKMQLFQITSTDLKELTTVIELYEPLVEKTFSATTGEFSLTDSPTGVTEIITDVSKGDPNIYYECGGFSNKAVSIGSNVPPCYLYDFEVSSSLANSSAKDQHNRGAGKEKPNSRKNSTLN